MCCLCLQVVGVLKKEVMKTQSKEVEKGPEYRQLLVQAIHSWYILQLKPPHLHLHLHPHSHTAIPELYDSL